MLRLWTAAESFAIKLLGAQQNSRSQRLSNHPQVTMKTTAACYSHSLVHLTMVLMTMAARDTVGAPMLPFVLTWSEFQLSNSIANRPFHSVPLGAPDDARLGHPRIVRSCQPGGSREIERRASARTCSMVQCKTWHFLNSQTAHGCVVERSFDCSTCILRSSRSSSCSRHCWYCKPL